MNTNEDNLKVLALLSLYKELSDHDESQFISHLIGEHDLLKKMGKWFEKNPFTTLFKTEFDIGSREKALNSLSELNEHDILEKFYSVNKKTNLFELTRKGFSTTKTIVSQFFWIRVGRYEKEDEQDIIFKKIMTSKGYEITETTCDLNYDNEYVMHYNNVEMGSEYPLGKSKVLQLVFKVTIKLAYGHITYEEAYLMSQNRVIGKNGGEIVKVDGYLATLYLP